LLDLVRNVFAGSPLDELSQILDVSIVFEKFDLGAITVLEVVIGG
jgi:hypothetical protein